MTENETAAAWSLRVHECEEWQMREHPSGGRYCGGCGGKEWFRLTRIADNPDDDGGPFAPPPVIGERRTLPEIARVLLSNMTRCGTYAASVQPPTIAYSELPRDWHADGYTWRVERLRTHGTTDAPPGFTPLTIHVIGSAIDRGREALAFFQLGQTEPVTVEIEDEHLWVRLDDCSLSWYLDTDDHEVRVTPDEIDADYPFPFQVYEYLNRLTDGELLTLDDGENEALDLAITGAMIGLAAFAYSASAAAVQAIGPAT